MMGAIICNRLYWHSKNNTNLGKFVNISTVIPNTGCTSDYLLEQDKPKPGKLEAWI